jgi:hypothetical protein
MTLRKEDDTGNLKRKRWVALYGELALGDSMDLS